MLEFGVSLLRIGHYLLFHMIKSGLYFGIDLESLLFFVLCQSFGIVLDNLICYSQSGPCVERRSEVLIQAQKDVHYLSSSEFVIDKWYREKERSSYRECTEGKLKDIDRR